MGDLVIATPFLQAASRQYNVTLIAKPYAIDLKHRFWPEVEVIPFTAPWTAFQGKYLLWKWPWKDLLRLRRRLVAKNFDFGLSARWDPRDHLVLKLARAKTRLGYPRLHSQSFLSQPLVRPDSRVHRFEHWRVMARALGFDLPDARKLALPPMRREGAILIHTGAGQKVRVWPLDRYQALANRLRQRGYAVKIVCDPDQHNWWMKMGEQGVADPRTMPELLALVDQASVFIGNDSGPGHLAAFCGVPTFTIFGPQLPEWFAPLHPASECLEGKPCPYKPCSDYCRFPAPLCMNTSLEEMWTHIDTFVSRLLPEPRLAGNAAPAS